MPREYYFTVCHNSTDDEISTIEVSGLTGEIRLAIFVERNRYNNTRVYKYFNTGISILDALKSMDGEHKVGRYKVVGDRSSAKARYLIHIYYPRGRKIHNCSLAHNQLYNLAKRAGLVSR
jgi:hypothetical protein